MKINVEIREVSHENLVDLLSTALYGNHRWCADYDIDTYNKNIEGKEDWCFEDKLAAMLIHGYPIQISDMYAEDKDDFYGKLIHRYDEVNGCMDYDVYMSDIIAGLKKAWDKGEAVKVLDLANEPENLDMWDADILLQYIVFGDYIYG